MNDKAVIRTKRRAQITRADLQAIIRLVAKRLTEAEACECVGVKARTWYGWKERHRNQQEYATLLARERGRYIAANLKQIERASEGRDGVRHDWRAAAHLAAVVAPERFATSAQQPQTLVLPQPVQVSIIATWLETAKAELASEQPGQVVDIVPVKLLPAPATAPPPKPHERLPSWWRKKESEPPGSA